MARHNFLVQRLVGNKQGNTGKPHSTDPNPEWRDGGCRGSKHVTLDAYGNEGYGTRKLAVEHVELLRKQYPDEVYRVIQIVS